MPSAPQSEPFAGTERFRIIRPLGEGGMGAVYEVEDLVNQERVALKTIRTAGSQYLHYLKREFRMLQGLEHPNLIRLGELIEDRGRWFFTMELVDGEDLLKHCRRSQPTAPDAPHAMRVAAKLACASTLTSPHGDEATRSHTELVTPDTRSLPGHEPAGVVAVKTSCDETRLRAALAGVADGLEALHGAGLIHRDVKPSNLMVTITGRVVILDFGLVQDRRQVKDYLHAHDAIAGTPLYMSPEQLRGDALTGASDWYGIGVSLYEALTGRPPFSGSTWHLFRAKQEGAFEPPSMLNETVPPDLEELCLGLLAPDPAARPTADDVRRVAARTAAGSARPRTDAPRPEAFVDRSEALADLLRTLHAVKPGSPSVALVSGPSGMGKSTLVRQFVAEGERRGAAVLEGRVIERESVPYKVFDSLVDEVGLYVKNLLRTERRDAAPPDADALARVFPVLDLFGTGSGDTATPADEMLDDLTELRTRGFASLRTLLGRLASRQPLVLCIDDLQWGDRDSAVLLRELLSPPDAPGVAFVLTCRSESEGDAVVDELLRAAAVAGPVRRVELGPLEDSASAALVQALAGTDTTSVSAAVDEVVRESRGSPFLIREIVDHLATAPNAVVTGAGADDRAFLRQAVAARLARLDERTRRLVQVAAVFGRPAPRKLLFAAAGLAPGDGQRAVASGETARLLRTRAPDRVDTYHDRLRAAVLDGLPDGAEPDLRHALASALARRDLPSEALLGLDFIGETDPAHARRLAVRAAKTAERALAFDRAASLYAMAAELGTPGEQQMLRRHQADALAAGGYSVEAAHLYGMLAAAASERNASELTRLAAECLLRAGHIEEGLAALTKVASSLGVQLGRGRAGTMLAILRNRARLGLHGLAYHPHAEAEVPPDTLSRVDTLYGAATSLGGVDFLRGAVVQSEHVLAALEAGEERRVYRAVATEVAFLAAAGHRWAKRADELSPKVHAAAERLDDTHLRGLAEVGDGYRCLFRGLYPPAYEHFRAAEHHLRQCPGTWFERCTARHLAHIALGSMGNFRVLADTVPRTIEEADRRDDRHTRSLFRGHPLVWLMLRDDRPADAEHELAVALEGWPTKGAYQVQYIVLSGRVMIRLYEGRPDEAARLMQEGEPTIRALLIPRIPFVMADVWKLRGQAAVALGDRSAAQAAIRALERFGEPIARGYAAAFRAPFALKRGDFAETERQLTHAIVEFEACGAAHDLAGARHRLGEIVGGARGEKLTAQAKAWMMEQGVKNPERMLQFLAPGYSHDGSRN